MSIEEEKEMRKMKGKKAMEAEESEEERRKRELRNDKDFMKSLKYIEEVLAAEARMYERQRVKEKKQAEVTPTVLKEGENALRRDPFEQMVFMRSLKQQQSAGATSNISGHSVYDIVAHLKKVPAIVSVFDMLKISESTRIALELAIADALIKGDEPHALFAEELSQPHSESSCFADEHSAITFFGIALRENHNKPLYIQVSGSDVLIRRALLDIGSSMNILPKSMLLVLGIPDVRVDKACAKIIRGVGSILQKVYGSIKLRV